MLPFYPTEIHLHDAHSQLPDTIGGGENPCYSKKFRGLIEEFEPNHHQFLPVDIYSVDGVVLDKYYLFKSANILNDTVAPEKSEVKWRESKNFEGKTERYWSKIPLKPLAIKRNAIRGIHFWKETERILEFVSSDLHDAMVEQGLVGFKFEKQKLI